LDGIEQVADGIQGKGVHQDPARQSSRAAGLVMHGDPLAQVAPEYEQLDQQVSW